MVTPYEPAVDLAEKLNRLAPGSTPKKTAFFNSGAEAVENAVKVARSHTGRPGVIAFSGSFHGRTLMALALTGKVHPYKAGLRAVPGRRPSRSLSISLPRESARPTPLPASIESSRTTWSPSEWRRSSIEPVLGEGGYIPAPFDFIREFRELCDRHGIVLVADEIQTGFGRTGRWFAVEHAGIEPDLMTTAKSLGGGFPISALTGKAEIMDAPGPGGLGGTYGASPISCAAALAVIDVIEEEGLIDRAQSIGGHVVKVIEGIAESDPRIGEVRGLGAMVGVEMVKDGESREPDPDRTKAITMRSPGRGAGPAVLWRVRERAPGDGALDRQ